MENITHVLNGRELDYLVINHMEPDHCAEIQTIIEKYKNVKIVCNAKTKQMIGQFFEMDLADDRWHIVKEGDSLNTG